MRSLALAALLALLAACTPEDASEAAANVDPVTMDAAIADAADPLDDVEPEAGESAWLDTDADVDTAKRFALVFGNGAYGHGDALPNPIADATLVAEALRQRGYQVLLARDRSSTGMRDDLRTFQAMSKGADLRVLYFAGHGFEFDNANYLMPVDLPVGIATLDRDAVRLHGLQLDRVTRELDEGAGAVVAIIDSCRVLPTRGAADTRTLAKQDVPDGMILAYATAPGQVASDSLRAYGVDADNSPYSYYLADGLRSRDVTSWDQVLMAAGNIVRQHTRGTQQPWWNANVDSFPAVGALVGDAESPTATGPLARFRPSSERRASTRFWAAEQQAAARLARDGSIPDAALQARAAAGDTQASIALAGRWWEDPARGSAIVALLEPHADSGNAVAQSDLGTFLYSVRGEDSQGRTARHWWQLASAQGIGEARVKLAVLDGDSRDAMDELIRGMVDVHGAIETQLERQQ